MTRNSMIGAAGKRVLELIGMSATSLIVLGGLIAALVAGRAAAEVPCPPQLDGAPAKACFSATSDPIGPTSVTPDYADPVSSVSLLNGRVAIGVANDAELSAALNAVTCGQDIMLATGLYQANHEVSISCPANNPVRIVGAAGFSAVLNGTITLNGARTILTGARITGNVFCHGTNNKIIANQFTGWSGNAINPGGNNTSGNSQCEIAYNEAWSPAPWGLDTGSNTQFRMFIRMTTGGNGQSSSAHRDVWVHHNFVHDMPEKPNPNRFSSGQSDAMEPGESNYDWTPSFDCGWYIESNLHEAHRQTGGGAVYDLKCGGSVVRYNTIRDSGNPRIDVRFGHSSVLESNWFETGGSSIGGNGNKLLCNRFGSGDLGIRILAGNVPFNSSENKHPQARDTLVSGNIGSLRIGHQYSSDYTFPAMNTVVENHTGSISLVAESGTIDRRNQAGSQTCSPAVELTRDNVGPAALAGASPAYRNARGL